MPYRKASQGITSETPKRRFDEWLLRAGPYGGAILALSAVLLIWIGALHFSRSEKTQAENAAIHTADNLARTFEEHIIRSIRAADQTLLYVRDLYSKNPESFDISLWSQNGQFLSDFSFQVVVIGKDGRMVASNIPGSKPGLDLSDREHFRVHADRQTDELFISKPVFGRVSNKWSIQVTRRINMPDGLFGGVVVLSLDPDYLTRFYKSINIGERGSIELVGVDGIVRALASQSQLSIGQSVAGGQLMQQFASKRSAAFYGRSPLDNIDRQYVYREVKGYPLIVAVGIAQDEVLRNYEANRRTDITIASALTLWLLGVTYLMLHYQRALASARDAAEAGTRARSEFLAMMSHEIRTPMNGVVGMSEVLLDSGLNDEQLSYARTMRTSAEHLLQVINDVLDFSKLEADRVDIEQVEFDLHDLVSGTAAVLATQAQERKLSLIVEIAPGVPAWIVGDPVHLRQVLLNLIGNALKFTETGGVSVAVAVDCQPMMPGNLRLAFSVKDTGIGIPKDAISLLFREFHQLDSSIARRFGGTGLGLAISKRLVDLMGGTVAVESEVGKGTTFRFTVDCKRCSPDRMPALSAENGPSLAPRLSSDPKRLRILLVEDNRTNQLVATKLLARLGYSADIANNGVEAVQACSAAAYDVVFMDVMMPEMDGLTATRAIRQLPRAHGTPRIIALTANAQSHERDMCLEAGMDDFVAKPVTRSSLEAALARCESQPAGTKASERAFETKPVARAAAFDAAIFGELSDTLGPADSTLVLEAFRSDLESQIQTMRESAKQADKSPVRRTAHTIKSSAASLGFLQLSDLAKAIERDAAGLNWPALDARIDELADAVNDIQSVIRQKLESCAALSQKGMVHA